MRLALIAKRTLLLLALSATLAGIAHPQEIPPGVSWIPVAGSRDAVAQWSDGTSSWYAISGDGGASAAVVRRADHTVKLRYATFDPWEVVPAPDAVIAAPESCRLYLVQYATQGLESYRQTLRDLGAEICHFVPAATDLVRMGPDTRKHVELLPFVRWVGPYHVAYRMDEVMRSELLAGVMPTRRYNIQVTRPGIDEKEAVRGAVLALGGSVDPLSPHGSLLQAQLSGPQLLAVLRRDDVLFIDRWSAPEDDMDIARTLGGADFLESVAGYTGAGVTAEVMDGGLLTTHADFLSNPPIVHGGNSTNQSHGTSTFGIVFGDGASNPAARGMLPDAQGLFAAYGSVNDRFAHTAELNLPPYEAVFQSNSWGDARTFFYTTVSADMDNILFQNDFVILQSQSNAGDQDSRPQAWAKNIISCGAVRHYNTLATTDDAWAGGASIGPASDGRIKPDINSFYDNILTTSSSGGHTTGFGGTSGATPICAGHVGLLFEMWNDGLFGNLVTPGAGVFANRPHMTTTKALLLNTATQYPFSGAGVDLTRVHQGWGRPDLQSAWNLRTRMLVVDESDVLTALQSTSYTVTVQPTDPELRATLIFADPPGNPAAAQARINDLTLKVTDPLGTIYWGNVGLLANNYSQSGGVANTVDTVEQVLISAPMPGAWTVQVTAFEVNQDGHLETPALDVDYALVVSGVDPPPPPTPDTGQANSANASMSVLFAQNINGQPPAPGINGPFFLSRSPGQLIRFDFGSQPGWPFLLMSGPLGKNNALFPGVGSLDLGLGGASNNYSDITTVLNGLAPTSFFDLLGVVDGTGSQTIGVTTPPVSPGVFGAFQAVMVDPVTGAIYLSAATEITVF